MRPTIRTGGLETWDSIDPDMLFFYEREILHKQHPLILHPDFTVRDPYGVLSRKLMEQLRVHGDAFIDGYRAATDRAPHYTTLRDYYLGLIDMPYELACQLAMFLTYTERYSNEWIHQPAFRPVL